MKTIVWDVDDVLNDLMKNWLEICWLKKHKNCSLTYNDITENPPNELLGVMLKDYLESLDKFRISKEADNMNPVSVVKSWFEKNGSFYRHIALTARPVDSVSYASEWVFRHFGKWIRGFLFVPACREGQNMPNYDKNKKEYIKWLGKGDLLIDDNPKNINDAEEIGLNGILFPRPWNKSKHFSIEEALNSIR